MSRRKRGSRGYRDYVLTTPKGAFTVKLVARKVKLNSVQWQKPPIGFRPICTSCGSELI